MSVKMGWLKTREEENYAPKTVIEGVYEASSGKLYDKVIKDYIDNKVKDVNPTVATLQTTVATHTTEINDLKSANNALNSSIDAIEKSIENIQDDGSDALYITDNSGYKIAQIDKYGIHSIEVHNKNTSLGAVADRMTAAETQLSNIADGDLSANDDTFYIIDKDDNIIAKIDKDGITSTDFIIKNGEEFSSLLDLISNNRNEIIELIDGLREALDTLTGKVSGLEASVSEIRNVINTSDSDDAFYIIDENNNIIAKIDKDGVHSIDFTVEDKRSNNIVSLVDLKTAYDKLSDNKETSIDTRLSSLKTELNSTINDHDTIISDHKTRLTILESNETVENSVRYLIKQLEEAVVNGALTYKDFKAIEDKLNQQDNILNLDETSNAFYIIDKDENVIFRVDNQGASTTGLFASNLTFNNNYNMQLNGVFVDSDKLKDIEVEFDIED